MATITKNALKDEKQSTGTPYGTATTLHYQLATNSSGAVVGADVTTAVTSGSVVRMGILPAGMRLDDAKAIVSTAWTATITAKLGFAYVDGVDSTDVPQDAAYFGAGLNAATAARLRMSTAKAPVKLAKEAYLVWTQEVAANAKAARIDFIVHGERMGPR